MDKSVNFNAATIRVFPVIASRAQRVIFTQKAGLRCPGRIWKRMGNVTRVNKTWVIRMIKIGLAELSVSFFWKTLDNGLEKIRVTTSNEVIIWEIVTFCYLLLKMAYCGRRSVS